MTEIIRCTWCGTDPLYVRYHDEEWGVPVHDDRKHFEFMLLDSMQAGLSWITILRKRENFRRAFDNFDPHLIAHYSEQKIAELLQDAGIIRNKLKIYATITNAQKFLEIQREFGSFDTYLWNFVDNKTVQNNYSFTDKLPVTSIESDAVSNDLSKRGFKFVGSTIIYAYMQAAGLVNDHLVGCFRHEELTHEK